MTLPNSSPDQAQGSKPPQPSTVRSNHAWRKRLPFEDRKDFHNARRGFVAGFDHDTINRGSNSEAVAWDFRAYKFEKTDEVPDTVNPSLWRLAQLNNISGLFRVTDRIYQIRGFDLSNMNVIEGESGLIIMDPLVTAQVARAGLDLYFQHRPRKPVLAVIYTHSHIDHFGGVKGVVHESDVENGQVRIYAPDGFMDEVVSENIFAGTAMSRRAQYMYGALLPRGSKGQVDAGLGKATSRGTVSLIPPTDSIIDAIEQRRIDGIDIEFQLTPGTEAPAEMNLYFPQFRALCVAENACRVQHNILTIRGALVRDPRIWSYYLGQTLARYGDRADVLFAQHHWPTWGRDNIVEFLADQRDMYAVLNDETLRLINHGLKPMEIAERLKALPEPLACKWHVRDCYGSVSHNVRAVYQRYMGFYDGNPANLNPLPPVETAKRTIRWMGGAEPVLEKARLAFDEGDYRWVVQIVNQVVLAEPENAMARYLQADALEQLGYQSENATWRNAYLTGAQELRHGVRRIRNAVAPDMAQALTPDLFFDYMAVRLNTDELVHQPLIINWHFTDLGRDYALTVRNGVMTHLAATRHASPDAEVTLTKSDLDRISLDELTLEQAMAEQQLIVAGDKSKVRRLFEMLDRFEPSFNIVTPLVPNQSFGD